VSRLEEHAPVRAPDRGRLAGLDGLRGLAALYVLLSHCWLLTYPGFPTNHGPSWLGWLMYAHLAVVFFLVVSGFSLAVGAARHGWRLDGVRRFARRRAWRILPPYWAALGFSLIVDWTITPQPHSVAPTARTVEVYGLLLQDVAVAPTPNGTFWSIAVEAELYVVFPLLLLLLRRLGAAATLVLATLPAVAVGLFGPDVPAVDKLDWLTPQLAPLFAFGLVGAGIVAARDRVRRLPWPGLAALAAAPVLAVIIGTGTVWTIRHYVWIDLAIGPAMTLLLVAVTTGRPEPLVRLLDTRPVRGLGRFSYSLYLIQLPIVVVVSRTLSGHELVAPGLPRFFATLALAVPLTLVLARLFAAVFEIPFQRHRGWPPNWRLPGRRPDASPAPDEIPAEGRKVAPDDAPAGARERAADEVPAGARERAADDRPA
jgi:peptidoglycan/LPS O-acetylase OafA/YrhL